MSNRATATKIAEALKVFRQHGGILRTRDALAQGIHQRTLYTMRDDGLLECLGRGLYRLADLPPLSDPDLVTVARKIPQGVICLISALHFHGITTQIPHAVSIAVNRGTERPRLQYPPTNIYVFSNLAFSEGIETHSIDGTRVRVYSPEKTLADCFKYRNKIGMDTVREAIEKYRDQRKPKPRELLRFARACRVERIMRPYLEAML
jgi:predicted transcriptional regulator of viral defense system